MRKGEKLLQKDKIAHILTLDGEELLIEKRQHWFLLALRIATTILISSFFVLLFYIVSLFLSFPPLLFIANVLFIFTAALAVIAKLTVDWLCHIYIVTTRKIVQLCLSPLFSDKINEILLDQVRCTEVDVRRDGFINELLDIGDITITFDRPTHEQEFVLAGIAGAQQVGMYLSDILVGKTREETPSMRTIWFRQKDKSRGFRFSEEIFPGKLLEVN